MARSSYIYILYRFNVRDELIGVFTVKHEMMTYIERNPGRYYAERHRDGQPEIAPTTVDLQTEKPPTST